MVKPHDIRWEGCVCVCVCVCEFVLLRARPRKTDWPLLGELSLNPGWIRENQINHPAFTYVPHIWRSQILSSPSTSQQLLCSGFRISAARLELLNKRTSEWSSDSVALPVVHKSHIYIPGGWLWITVNPIKDYSRCVTDVTRAKGNKAIMFRVFNPTEAVWSQWGVKRITLRVPIS